MDSDGQVLGSRQDDWLLVGSGRCPFDDKKAFMVIHMNKECSLVSHLCC